MAAMKQNFNFNFQVDAIFRKTQHSREHSITAYLESTIHTLGYSIFEVAALVSGAACQGYNRWSTWIGNITYSGHRNGDQCKSCFTTVWHRRHCRLPPLPLCDTVAKPSSAKSEPVRVLLAGEPHWPSNYITSQWCPDILNDIISPKESRCSGVSQADGNIRCTECLKYY